MDSKDKAKIGIAAGVGTGVGLTVASLPIVGGVLTAAFAPVAIPVAGVAALGGVGALLWKKHKDKKNKPNDPKL